jgi:CRISPR-associated protein Cas1
MEQLLNTLYVMTQGAYVRLDHETLKVDVEGSTQVQVPMHHLGGIICLGNVLISPGVIHACASNGRFIVMLDHVGHFKARIVGPTTGNVLLRRAQHKALDDHNKTLAIARNLVAGKIRNARTVMLRGAREADSEDDISALRATTQKLASSLSRLEQSSTIDQVRGIEGEAARAYFATFDRLIRVDRDAFSFKGRTRRPPRDRINALLSFLYALVLSDCVASVEGVGLDPQVGYLHTLRPGRPALALDLLEEFRTILADRVALTLVNRRQITPDHFEERPGGSVYLNDAGRKEVVISYQKRKQEKVTHHLLDRSEPLGVIPHIQARLLARTLRGDLPEYPPFTYR